MCFFIARASTVFPLIQLDNSYFGVAGGLSISGGRRLAVEKLAKAFVKLKQQTNKQTILDLVARQATIQSISVTAWRQENVVY